MSMIQQEPSTSSVAYSGSQLRLVLTSILTIFWPGLVFLFSIIAILVRCYHIPWLSSPLTKIPGPKLCALTKWRLAYEDWQGTRTRYIHKLHAQYGDAVRVSPNEVSFNSLAALRTIYGAGSGFERTDFYQMFKVYGRDNLFTFGPANAHGGRKKLLNHAYSKSTIMNSKMALVIEGHARSFLKLVEGAPGGTMETFLSLHYFSLDSITAFLYGSSETGATSALEGDARSRALLDDILDHGRRRLTWFAVHWPNFTKWLYNRTGLIEKMLTYLKLLPMNKPTTYTGIRAHALNAMRAFKSQIESKDEESIISRLYQTTKGDRAVVLDDLDIASECADHFLAGIDTTSDTLMFLIWVISLPANKKYQDRLIAEVSELDESTLINGGMVTASAKLPWLDILIKETLRLYAPLPASEPRSLPVDSIIDGYAIPARTVVSMSPFSLHRKAEVFYDPLRFRPERWLGDSETVNEMKRLFWAFSSGGRTCIGLHLAMAEMTTLMVAIYREYSTVVREGKETVSPGITSRFEVFGDDVFERMEEHVCWIHFKQRT